MPVRVVGAAAVMSSTVENGPSSTIVPVLTSPAAVTTVSLSALPEPDLLPSERVPLLVKVPAISTAVPPLPLASTSTVPLLDKSPAIDSVFDGSDIAKVAPASLTAIEPTVTSVVSVTV